MTQSSSTLAAPPSSLTMAAFKVINMAEVAVRIMPSNGIRLRKFHELLCSVKNKKNNFDFNF